MLFILALLPWLLLPLIPKAPKKRKPLPIRATIQRAAPVVDNEAELQHLAAQRRLYLDLYAEIEGQPQTIATRRQLITLNDRVFRIEQKMQKLKGVAF